jgi:hypothetical protein
MRKHCYSEKIDLEVLMDLHVFSTDEYEKMIRIQNY